ncbi:MAG: hypothetical protein EOM26_09980 [Alphaproteobacteria bacterium]|nr:hypothetical protein [Alphaproteobacteria bacterium]
MNPVNRMWWLWLPTIVFVFQIIIELFVDGGVLSVLHSENGPHETLQVVTIIAAFFVALAALATMKVRAHPWLATWLALAAICCFYVAGEEISWGQHVFEWGTPEFWMDRNDQGETNLHNTSSWLDQKPRLILLMGVVVGGLVVPALKKFRPALLPARFEPVYPSALLSYTAVLAMGVKVAEKAGEAAGLTVFERASEIEELYLYYFVLLYLIELRRRIAAPT